MKQKVAKMCEDLKAVLAETGEDCIVVYQMLDANFFLAKSDEGGLLPICKLISGEYHVFGELAFAPKELQYSIFCTANPLLEVAGVRRTILLTPLPRYLLTSCCSNPEHVSNMKGRGTVGTRRQQLLTIADFTYPLLWLLFSH